MPETAYTIGVVASRIRYEEKRILEALESARQPYCYIDPRKSWLPIGRANRLPWQDWDVALNREISFTRCRYIARLLDAGRITAVNGLHAIETCGDKCLTSLALEGAGLPTPKTYLAFSPAAALAAMEELGYPAVIKPLVGSWGSLCARLPDRETAEAILEHRQALANPQQHVFYVQQYIDCAGRDIRLVVIGDAVIGAIQRQGSGWRANTARGAEAIACRPTADAVKLALAAARATKAVFAGVDLVEDRDGRLYVLEVNHCVEFHGLESAVDVDVAGAMVAYARALAGDSAGDGE
jgi:[lysine-biosynthesis-protein LysW]---L-2-aminoadipate ligase